MERQSPAIPTASLIIREHDGQPFYEAKFRHQGRQVKRRLGPAWVTRDQDSQKWIPRRGRVRDGFLDECRAHVAAAELVTKYLMEAAEIERIEEERRRLGVTFREVAHAYIEWLEHVRGAKPSTIRSHRSDLAEPGTPHRRGNRVTAGHIMAALGDRPAAKVAPKEIEQLLRTVAATGVSPRPSTEYARSSAQSSTMG